MRWFTRDCLTGGLEDEEWQKRYDDHEAHFVAMTSSLAAESAERELAELSLSHGQVSSWTTDDSGFEVCLLVGDLQRGYEWVQIRYDNAEIVPSGAASNFEEWPLTEREVGADELERLPDGRFEHRFLLWPDGEFGVRFSACRVTRRPADPSDRIVDADR